MRSKNFWIVCTVVAASALLAAPSTMEAQGAQTQQQQSAVPSVGAPGAQGIGEPAFVAHIRRNGDVEADLSKLALKNSSNDAVKKLAQQIASGNRKNQMMLASATASNPNLSALPYEQVPDLTRQAEKQMKTAKGTQFDEIYLSQINAYVQDDLRTVNAALSSLKSSDLEMVLPQFKTTAEDHLKMIDQVAQSENIKIQP